MGDRALVTMFTVNEDPRTSIKELEFSPAMYLHWNGDPDWVEGLRKKVAERMDGRTGDVCYGFARMVGLAHEMIDGNVSLGVYPMTKEEALAEDAGKFMDNGIYYSNAKDWSMVRNVVEVINFLKRERGQLRTRMVQL